MEMRTQIGVEQIIKRNRTKLVPKEKQDRQTSFVNKINAKQIKNDQI